MLFDVTDGSFSFDNFGSCGLPIRCLNYDPMSWKIVVVVLVVVAVLIVVANFVARAIMYFNKKSSSPYEAMYDEE